LCKCCRSKNFQVAIKIGNVKSASVELFRMRVRFGVLRLSSLSRSPVVGKFQFANS
jgi:hypothetical protein